MTITKSSPAFTLVHFEQGTPAWLDWRSQGIGASDAPTIMGENPWKSASQLFEEKSGKPKPSTNAAMARGSALEPEARRRFGSKFGLSVEPACMQSLKLEWLRASVDGIAADASRVVEIKCGESVYRKTAQSLRVPGYYMGQLQHILAVTNLEAIDFWCYLPKRPELHVVVPRDQNYIDNLLEVEYAFWVQVCERRAQIMG